LAITADSGLGKYKTIAIGISVYVVGMVMASLGSMPQVFGEGVTEEGLPGDDWWQNNLTAIRGVAISGLMLIAFGNGIKVNRPLIKTGQ